MGQFFKFLLASCLGVIIAVFVLVGVGTLILTGLASQAEKPAEVKPNSVLHLTLDEAIPEKTNNIELTTFSLQDRKTLGLHEILQTIEKAKEDDDIKGIFIEPEALVSSGIVTAHTLRNALLDFKESGKFIVAYSKYYTQGSYYLSSVADEIYLNPMGLVDFRGFGVQIPYFKKMLDKLGVEMQVFYAGQFKSATEPYRLTRMSDQNRFQTREYLSDIYRDFLADISKSRKVPVAQLHSAAGDYVAGTAKGALKAGLVDAIGYRDEALKALRKRLSLGDDEDIPSITLRAYNASNPPAVNYDARDRIAVVFAEGAIVDGEGENGSIGDKRYTEVIRRLRRDDRVKAIVMRVNSPGGSAMASENIWRELMLAREAHKPVVVSMGDYAASGGYYIACAADSIIAEPGTLTGSIGVFSIIPNIQRMLNDKIGITFDTVKTSDFGTGLSFFYDMNPEEERFMQSRTDEMYETFLQRVSKGRKMSRDSVNAIAQGRVWTGTDAIGIGLADRLGNLQDAIETAAEMAGIKTYRISEYPSIKDPLQQLLEEFMGGDDERNVNVLLRTKMPEYYPYVKFIEELRQARDVQARLPIVLKF